MTFQRRAFRWLATPIAITAAGLAGCGGGGGGGTTQPPGAIADTTEYRHSVVIGRTGDQTLLYRSGAGTGTATVTATNGSALLPAGATPLVAEHTEPALPGLRIVCVSGPGETTNVITGINPGVIAESAAVLFDDRWKEVDASAAWAAAISSDKVFEGWENCGVKPEGLPSPSSRLMTTGNGGYAEDIYDGNPGTTFNVVRRNVSAADVAALLSSQGQATTEDPLRPLTLMLRAWRNETGQVVFVETGIPTQQAPIAARGFIALYVPTS